jgi:hypothetical protein
MNAAYRRSCLQPALAAAVVMLSITSSASAERSHMASKRSTAVPAGQFKAPKAKRSAAPAYRNGQELNRILVKVAGYKPSTFYMELKPQRPTGGPSLLALPSLTLQKLLTLARKHPELVVSGRVSTYGGKAYLMLAPNIYRPSQFGAKPSTPKGKISRRRASREKASEILSHLLSHSISAPASERIVIRPAEKVKLPLVSMSRPGDVWAPAIAEGTYVWNRMGRLIYDPSLRQWVFIFLSDGRRVPEPPMILLPSPQLQEMENLDAQAHSRAILRISGIVTEFRHRNFLMPTYVQLYHNLGRY